MELGDWTYILQLTCTVLFFTAFCLCLIYTNLKPVWDILSQTIFSLALFEIHRDEIVSHWLYVNFLAMAIIPLSEENVTMRPPLGKYRRPPICYLVDEKLYKCWLKVKVRKDQAVVLELLMPQDNTVTVLCAGYKQFIQHLV